VADPRQPRARRFVSRGGDKLDAALDALSIKVNDARALDAGASTGGFTDCLLQRGAREVIAVDVAYGQFAWTLRNDGRVRLLERTNVRTLRPESVGNLDVLVADLSFISLSGLASTFAALRPEDMVLMVKPQFELPRAHVPAGGVVREPRAWIEAMETAARAYRNAGYALCGAVSSPLPGPKGNREFFLHFEREGTDVGDDVIERAAETAP